MNFMMCEGLSNKGMAAPLSSKCWPPQFNATDVHDKRYASVSSSNELKCAELPHSCKRRRLHQ